MHIVYKRHQIGMLAMVLLLSLVTMYMAFAGPYSLFNLRQSETTEIKSVIVIARHGDEWPTSEAYFMSEPAGQQQQQTIARQQQQVPGQLTNAGKERMFLLGKFLKLRYYDRVLDGDPQRLHIRSADSDKSLESAQLLAAGLNPPKSHWLWSRLSSDQEITSHWQPKAVHTTDEHYDDLLSSRSKCLVNYENSAYAQAIWKNSTKYLHALNEFRHDLQDLRQKTGLEFEDDLEMLANIEESLKARSALGEAPAWYTSTLAQRLAHIAAVTYGCKFGIHETQRLYAGRLLDSLARDIFLKIRTGQNQHGRQRGKEFSLMLTEEEDELDEMVRAASIEHHQRRQQARHSEMNYNYAQVSPADDLLTTRSDGIPDKPSMSLYVTDKQHLIGILQALKIYSTLPHYGYLLLIELHYDASNDVHFLRLFSVNALSQHVFPEPVRVNPVACPMDSVECSPEQFEQNIRHLSIDKRTWWQQLCENFAIKQPNMPMIHDEPSANNNDNNISTDSLTLPASDNDSSTKTSLDDNNNISTTAAAAAAATTTTTTTENYDKLDHSLIVGPTDLRPTMGELPSLNGASATTAIPTSTEISSADTLTTKSSRTSSEETMTTTTTTTPVELEQTTAKIAETTTKIAETTTSANPTTTAKLIDELDATGGNESVAKKEQEETTDNTI